MSKQTYFQVYLINKNKNEFQNDVQSLQIRQGSRDAVENNVATYWWSL